MPTGSRWARGRARRASSSVERSLWNLGQGGVGCFKANPFTLPRPENTMKDQDEAAYVRRLPTRIRIKVIASTLIVVATVSMARNVRSLLQPILIRPSSIVFTPDEYRYS